MQPPEQAEPPDEGAPRGYVRMAVMDGKVLEHRVSAILKQFQIWY